MLVALSPTVDVNEELVIPEPCNGSSDNCEKLYTEVTYPETHNAHATIADGFNYLAANHRENLSNQWDAGFRAFMLDLHHAQFSTDFANTSFCHGSQDLGVHPCILGSQNAVELMEILSAKMDENPRDITTLLFELYVPYSHVEYILNASGLLDRAHIQQFGIEWPTLHEMIANNRTLVVFVQGATDSNYPYLHSYSEFGWTTHYADRHPDEMTCDVLLGDSTQPVWHMNNWLGLESGLTDFVRAPIVNSYDFLLNRSLECWAIHGSKPTFIAVDWWTDGEAVNVTHTLNQMDHWSDELPLRAATDSR